MFTSKVDEKIWFDKFLVHLNVAYEELKKELFNAVVDNLK